MVDGDLNEGVSPDPGAEQPDTGEQGNVPETELVPGVEAAPVDEVAELQREVTLAVTAPHAFPGDVVVMVQAPSEDQLHVIGHSFLKDRRFHLWDALRKQYPTWQPKISNLNLSGAVFGELDFSHVHFENFTALGADMRKVNLSHAYLEGALLTGIKLEESNCEGVRMGGAKLGGAKLSHAILRGADLSRAVLSGADMSYIIEIDGCNLDGANLSGINVVGTDLSRANITIETIRGGMITSPEQLEPTSPTEEPRSRWRPFGIGA